MASLFKAAALSGLSLASAQDWFNLPMERGPGGDYSLHEIDNVLKYDVGVDGKAAYVHAGNFTPELLKHGAKPMSNTKVLKPKEWSEKVHVKLVDETVKDIHGTKTVLTDRGLQPELQSDYWSYWKLETRPRKMALLVEDMIEDYRIYVGYLTPKIQKLIKVFRENDMPIYWSNWLRRPQDKLYGSLDRFYGPEGVKTLENPMYVYAKDGAKAMHEIAPTEDEVKSGHNIHSAHLSKFADVAFNGKSYLREELREHGIDTLVVTGAWTEDCILSTVLDGSDTENVDMVVVTDGVGTATPGHYPALDVMEATSALLKTADEVVEFVNAHAGDEKFIMKAEYFPPVHSHPHMFPPPAQVVFTVPQFVLLVFVIMVSSVAVTFGVQRAITQRKNRQSYLTMDVNLDELDALPA